MLSPFEELEYLADYLPDEGEKIIVSRESGELICVPFNNTSDLRDGVDDSELYGLLVQSNEHLTRCNLLPLLLAASLVFWSTIFVHGIMDVSMKRWYLIPGLAFLSLYAALYWGKVRQHQLFYTTLLPRIKIELVRRKIKPLSLLAGVRQHGELQTLFNELSTWMPDRHSPVK